MNVALRDYTNHKQIHQWMHSTPDQNGNNGDKSA
jgi:hypothetical protein